MPWISPFAKHLVEAQESGLITSDEYEAIRELLTRGEPWRQPVDTSVDWDKPLEPGPVHVPIPEDQRERAKLDAEQFGIGFTVDGKRVDPARVVILRPIGQPNDMTSTELWRVLEEVLRAKGAGDAWLAHAMPDLHIAAMQFGFSQYGRGHDDARSGIELPNPPPGYVPTLTTRLAQWRDNLRITAGSPIAGDALHGAALDFVVEQLDSLLSAAPLPVPPLSADTPEARARLAAAFVGHLRSSARHEDEPDGIPPIGGPPGIRHISDHVFPDDD